MLFGSSANSYLNIAKTVCYRPIANSVKGHTLLQNYDTANRSIWQVSLMGKKSFLDSITGITSKWIINHCDILSQWARGVLLWPSVSTISPSLQSTPHMINPLVDNFRFHRNWDSNLRRTGWVEHPVEVKYQQQHRPTGDTHLVCCVSSNGV